MFVVLRKAPTISIQLWISIYSWNSSCCCQPAIVVKCANYHLRCNMEKEGAADLIVWACLLCHVRCAPNTSHMPATTSHQTAPTCAHKRLGSERWGFLLEIGRGRALKEVSCKASLCVVAHRIPHIPSCNSYMHTWSLLLSLVIVPSISDKQFAGAFA